MSLFKSCAKALFLKAVEEEKPFIYEPEKYAQADEIGRVKPEGKGWVSFWKFPVFSNEEKKHNSFLSFKKEMNRKE